MNARAPNWSSLGAQRLDVKNFRPISWNAGHDSFAVETVMSTRMTRTSRPEPRARRRKNPSAPARRPPPRTGAGGGGCGSVGASVVRVTCGSGCRGTVARATLPTPPLGGGDRGSGGDHDLVDLRDRRVAQVVGKVGEVELVRHVLPVAQHIAEPGLERRALGLVGLVLVDEDPGRRRDR